MRASFFFLLFFFQVVIEIDKRKKENCVKKKIKKAKASFFYFFFPFVHFFFLFSLSPRKPKKTHLFQAYTTVQNVPDTVTAVGLRFEAEPATISPRLAGFPSPIACQVSETFPVTQPDVGVLAGDQFHALSTVTALAMRSETG